MRCEDERAAVCKLGESYMWLAGAGGYSCDAKYCLLPYEESLRLIDLERAIAKEEFVLARSFSGGPPARAYLVGPGTKLCIMEFSHQLIVISAKEGERVSSGEVLGHAVSEKGNVINLRSVCDGVVLLVIHISWEVPEKYVIVTASENELREIVIGKS